MNAQIPLKPLVVALALAVSMGAYADRDNRGQTRANGSVAEVNDEQTIHHNTVYNDETKNNATIDAATLDMTGNAGVNVVAGDNNQQANAAAIATADSFFVFGIEAKAKIGVDQDGHDNKVYNDGTQNNALLNSDLSSTGNLGLNLAAGNFNQQKNDLAIANSETAFVATASVNMKQELEDNQTDNDIGKVYPVDEGDDGLEVVTAGFNIPGFPGQWGNDDPQTPVVNNATLSGSVTASGNFGLNIAAGSGNQQANALAIAAGCTACPSNTPQ
ncbi:hypothetical protein [Pseudomonas sp. BMS12]|uniref:hypothetical protein n=1 Tax=Pseudomonas sp. BMS12 TaxID=1796033 RepID=UPI00083AF76B|nr:hypothetical protein [Pseudomonas sp. BMS12]